MNTGRQGFVFVSLCLAAGLLVLQGRHMLTKAQNVRLPLSGVDVNVAVPQEGSQQPATSENAIRSDVSQGVRANLFGMPEVPASPPAPPAAPVVSVPATSVPVTPVVPVAPDPFADYVYSGTVVADGITTALIEHRKNKQGWYVEAGETWQNFRVLTVDEREITLLVDGQTRTLLKSDAMNLVPLQADRQAQVEGSKESADSTNSTYLARNLWVTQLGEAQNAWLSFDTVTSFVRGLTPAETKRIKDDVFEGRLSPEEGERKLQAGQPTQLLIGVQPLYETSFDSYYIDKW